MNTVKTEERKFDTIIIGAGLGGIRAARELLKKNKKVAIVTSAEFCSGASFFKGTWGLGMVAPKNEEDKEDLLRNIDKVGSGLSNIKLSSILVDKVQKEIDSLKSEGVNFKESLDKEGVVPCFDSNKRKWYGFDFTSARKSFSNLLKDTNFEAFTQTKVLDIYNRGRGSKGILCIDKDNKLYVLKSKTIIIASGGFTSLYEHNFSMELNSPLILDLAMKQGCELINIEFIQFIPAYISPLYKTIFNERVFKYITLRREDGRNILESIPHQEEIMAERSTYGPFTTRLKSQIVDIEMFKYYKTNNESVYFKYPKNIENVNDTLIYNYFNWLKEKNVDVTNEIYIAPFAHACNGGLKIDENAETTVDGIFACGEVTGGVHGADRIGGLATGNALVFGKIAGESAALYCEEVEFKDFLVETMVCNNVCGEKDLLMYRNILINLRKTLYEETAIIRSESSIKTAVLNIEFLKKEASILNLDIGKKIQLNTYFDFSLVLLDRMLQRKNSVGGHYRIDS